jgi:threonine synthase
MWRYQELLPLRCDEVPVTLGEGGTPLLRLRALGSELGLDLFLKDEGRNPTGSFKDRGVSTAVTRAVLDGVRSFVISSAGNAAAALAAYAARAGVPARVYIPSDTPSGVIRRCRAFGAEVIEVKGLITDCARLAAGHAEHTGAFDLSTLNEPYRIEGKKTMMLGYRSSGSSASCGVERECMRCRVPAVLPLSARGVRGRRRLRHGRGPTLKRGVCACPLRGATSWVQSP